MALTRRWFAWSTFEKQCNLFAGKFVARVFSLDLTLRSASETLVVKTLMFGNTRCSYTVVRGGLRG
jgi:hypothetical protein